MGLDLWLRARLHGRARKGALEGGIGSGSLGSSGTLDAAVVAGAVVVMVGGDGAGPSEVAAVTAAAAAATAGVTVTPVEDEGGAAAGTGAAGGATAAFLSGVLGCLGSRCGCLWSTTPLGSDFFFFGGVGVLDATPLNPPRYDISSSMGGAREMGESRESLELPGFKDDVSRVGGRGDDLGRKAAWTSSGVWGDDVELVSCAELQPEGVRE
jgi:hypothetical protein